LQTIQVVERLPKTRSGKILRKNLRQLVDGEQIQVPSTIEDPSVIEEIQAQWHAQQG
jgi:propionyl-CoA synthetase